MKNVTLICFIALLTLCFIHLSYGQVGPTCGKIKEAIQPETNKAKVKFLNHICKKCKCKPTISEWPWGKKNGYDPVMNHVQKSEGMDEATRKKVDGTVDEVAKDIIKDCKASLGSSHLCQNNEDAKKFAKCIEDNAVPIVMGHMFDLMPLVAEPKCLKHMKCAKDKATWKLVDKIMDKFGKACKK